MKYFILYFLSFVNCTNVFACNKLREQIVKEAVAYNTSFIKNDNVILYKNHRIDEACINNINVRFCRALLISFANSGIGLMVNGSKNLVMRKGGIIADIDDINVDLSQKQLILDAISNGVISDTIGIIPLANTLLSKIHEIDKEALFSILFLKRIVEISLLRYSTTETSIDMLIGQDVVFMKNAYFNIIGFIITFYKCLKIKNDILVFDSSFVTGVNKNDILGSKDVLNKINLPYMNIKNRYKDIYCFVLFAIEDIFQEIVTIESQGLLLTVYSLFTNIKLSMSLLLEQEKVVLKKIDKHVSVIYYIDALLNKKIGRDLTSLVIEFFIDTKHVFMCNAWCYSLINKNPLNKNIKYITYSSLTYEYSKYFAYIYTKEIYNMYDSTTLSSFLKGTCIDEKLPHGRILYGTELFNTNLFTGSYCFDKKYKLKKYKGQTCEKINTQLKKQAFLLDDRLAYEILKSTPFLIYSIYNMSIAFLFFAKMYNIITEIDLPKAENLNIDIIAYKQNDRAEKQKMFALCREYNKKSDSQSEMWSKYFIKIIKNVKKYTSYSSLTIDIIKLDNSIQAGLIARFIKSIHPRTSLFYKNNKYSEIYIPMYFLVLMKINGVNYIKENINILGFIDFCIFINDNIVKDLSDMENVDLQRYKFSDIFLHFMKILVFSARYHKETNNTTKNRTYRKKPNKSSKPVIVNDKNSVMQDFVELTIIFFKRCYKMHNSVGNFIFIDESYPYTVTAYKHLIIKYLVKNYANSDEMLKKFAEYEGSYNIQESFSVRTMITEVEYNTNSFIYDID